MDRVVARAATVFLSFLVSSLLFATVGLAEVYNVPGWPDPRTEFRVVRATRAKIPSPFAGGLEG